MDAELKLFMRSFSAHQGLAVSHQITAVEIYFARMLLVESGKNNVYTTHLKLSCSNLNSNIAIMHNIKLCQSVRFYFIESDSQSCYLTRNESTNIFKMSFTIVQPSVKVCATKHFHGTVNNVNTTKVCKEHECTNGSTKKIPGLKKRMTLHCISLLFVPS